MLLEEVYLQKNHTCKILAIGIIALFMGVSVSSAISVDTESTIVEIVEDCGCEEVSDSDLIKVERLLNKVEVYSKLLLVLSKYNPEVKDKCEEILQVINSNKQWNFPIICDILESILNLISDLIDFITSYLLPKIDPIFESIILFLFAPIGFIGLSLVPLGIIFGCDWVPEPS